jgi:hypothetical protein
MKAGEMDDGKVNEEEGKGWEREDSRRRRRRRKGRIREDDKETEVWCFMSSSQCCS